jgi:hypothetical protein
MADLTVRNCAHLVDDTVFRREYGRSGVETMRQGDRRVVFDMFVLSGRSPAILYMMTESIVC